MLGSGLECVRPLNNPSAKHDRFAVGVEDAFLMVSCFENDWVSGYPTDRVIHLGYYLFDLMGQHLEGNGVQPHGQVAEAARTVTPIDALVKPKSVPAGS